MNKTLKKILIDRGMTMVELAKMLDVTPSYLSQITNGHEPGYPLREKIAFTLNVSYESLWRQPTPAEIEPKEK